MAAGVSIPDLVLRSVLVMVLLAAQAYNVGAVAATPYSTTVESELEYVCPIECVCHQLNETSSFSTLWMKCTVDYFSQHLKDLLQFVSIPWTRYAFFTCTTTQESLIWDGAFQEFGQLAGLIFDNCNFQKLSRHSFRGLDSITQLIIKNAAISKIEDDLFTFLPQLELLEISYSSLTHLVPICMAQYLRILNISGNHLALWEDSGLHCPDGSVFQLETLDVNHNFLTEIPQWFGHTLPNLYHLGLANNYISKTSESPFWNLQKLTFLDISNNSFTSFHPEFFKGCTNLNLLGLSRNKAASLPHGLVANLSVLQTFEISEMNLEDDVWMELVELRHLIHLNMSGNKLTTINTDVMSQLLRLEFCYLDHNKISTFPKTAFEYQMKLNTLDLSFNEIHETPSGAFKNQDFLKYLHLHHNKMTTVASDAFSQLKELLTFDISHNIISSLSSQVFNGLLKVTHLDLSSNNLTLVNSDIFSKNVQLIYLNVSHNSLTEMAFVSQLFLLETLDISHNMITDLPPSFLADLRSLATFSISHNELKTLPVKMFKGCENLKTLDLSYNAISQLDEVTFSSAGNIRTVNLSHNEVTDINNVFSGLKSLESLDLSSNSISKILRGQFPHHIKHINLRNNKIMFISAHTFKSLNILTFVDLSRNNLSTVSRMDMEIAFKMGILPRFDIQYNPFICDCKLGWLKDWSTGKLKDMPTLPNFDIGTLLSCSSPFYDFRQTLQRLSREEFLCKYTVHCEESCMCCDYTCYCKYQCPAMCQCYIGDDYWHVHRVKCSSANLTTVPTELPEGATDLHLDGNNIQVLGKHAFLALQHVENLYLNNSQIHMIENSSFKGLKSVRRLHLNDNHLTVISSLIFNGLDNLEELLLNNNQIHHIDVQAFFVPAALGLLNIQGNALSTISLDDLSQFINRTFNNGVKTKLYLSGNPWSCDPEFVCRFLSFIQASSLFIADLSNIECVNSETIHKPSYIESGSFLVKDVPLETCVTNLSSYENMTRQSMEAMSSSTEKIYAAIAVCVVFVFTLALFITAYANRHLLQVLCFTKFGCRMFKMAKPSDDTERPYDAFISYSNKDEDFVVRELAPRLENGEKKFKLCVHYRDFPVGACIAETIVRSVEASKRTILVASDNFLDSEWCRFEFQTAHQQVLSERRNRVILILLHDLDPEKLDNTLKVYMRTRTYLKYDDPWFWEKLMFAMPDPHQRKLMPPRSPVPGGDQSHPGQGQTTPTRSCCETIHNDMYEIPVLESPGHYQLANNICGGNHTNNAYHNSDITDSTSGYHNGSVDGSCSHYEEVGPGSSSTRSTPHKQIGTPPPVPSIPREGLLSRQKLLTLKL